MPTIGTEENSCDFFIIEQGRSGQAYSTCKLAKFDGAFGPEDCTCNSQGNPEECHFVDILEVLTIRQI